MRKIIVLFSILLLFSSCKSILLDTYYRKEDTYYRELSKKELMKEIESKMDISATVIDITKKEKSPLTFISIHIKNKNKNNIIKESPKKIKITSNGKEYFIDIFPESNTYYPVHSNGIVIDSDEFILELGKIKFDDGTTLNIPPLLFKRYIYVSKLNRILDALNQNTKEERLFEGTIEEYREWKKKNK